MRLSQQQGSTQCRESLLFYTETGKGDGVVTHIKLSCSDAMIHALDDFLRDPERISVTNPSIEAEYLLNRVYMIHVQAIAELVDACSDLSFVDNDVMVRVMSWTNLVKLDAFLTPERVFSVDSPLSWRWYTNITHPSTGDKY